jgi:hypothetical protein
MRLDRREERKKDREKRVRNIEEEKQRDRRDMDGGSRIY